MKTIKFVSEALTLSVLDEQGKAKVGVFPVGTKVVTETLPASFSSLEKKGIIKVRQSLSEEVKTLAHVKFV
jgi:hypothetical protein